MERIVYRKTLDVHKNGIQFTLQGFDTADNLSRRVEISLMASGDTIDFPLDRITAMVYVTTPKAKEPSINECTIKDNTIVYDFLPIVEEGITELQIKLIETSPEGAKSVLAAPRFAVEVTKGNAEDEGATQTTTFTALEDAVAKASAVYNARFLRMELTSDCTFKAYYADGTVYETDLLKQMFLDGNALLSQSFAIGGSGVRKGEDTDNSKFYSNISKSEALNAKDIMKNSEEILAEVRTHGLYTAFSVDFETGEVEYVSPSFKFVINRNTGELDAIGQSYSFDTEVGRVMTEWLANNGVLLTDLERISGEHEEKIDTLRQNFDTLSEIASNNTDAIAEIKENPTPVELGGTGAKTAEEAIVSLGIDKYQKPWDIDTNVGRISYLPARIDVIQHTQTSAPMVRKDLNIYMKNSGKVYLDFKYFHHAHNVNVNHENSRIAIFLNGDVVKSYTNFVSPENNEWMEAVSCRIPLEVKNGDVVQVSVQESATTHTEVTSWREIQVHSIVLCANVETPYTYFSLSDEAPEDLLKDFVDDATASVEN